MGKAVRGGRRSLRLARDVEPGAVDVFFDEHRVWSTKVPRAGRSGPQLVWPQAIRPYLSGTSTVAVRSSADGHEIASGTIDFGGAGRVSITDAQGRWLAINKWNRLGPSFAGDDSGVRDRLLATSARVAEQMAGWGYQIYIVGGSLLGAMRNGELLPHDDDIDFAFLADESDPQQLTLRSFEVERRLVDAGYTVVRHSHAHLELVFLTDDGSSDYYIDIFTGYYSDDGLYNQPFAMRGKLNRANLVPVKPMRVNDVTLPAPAVPEAWLEMAYGPNWLVPDPGFRWVTPRATLRRFENEFGVFNRQRVFWEKTWQAYDKRGPAQDGEFDDVDRFLELLPPRAFVVDLGCGDGRHSERIAAAGHEVLGVEYSFEALRLARQTRPADVDYAFLNLNDRHQLVRFALELIDHGRQPYFFARDLLHMLPPLGRTDLFVTLSGVLDDQTFLYTTFDADAVPRVPPNPKSWNMTVNTLRREAWRWKLGTTVLGDRRRRTELGDRSHVTALVWR